MSDLNAQQKDVVTTLLGRLPENQPVALDPSDPDARAAIDLFLDLSNKGSDRYPGLHDALGQAARNGGTNGGAPVDQPAVVDLGRDTAGRATSSTWVGAPGLPFVSGAGTLVMDAESRDPLAFGTATSVGESLVQVGTDPATAKQGTRRQTVLTVSHAQASADEAPRFTAVQRTVTSFDYSGPPATVTDPVVQDTGNPYPYIGLGRPTGQGYNPDCDYAYNSPINNNPQLIVPFTGNVTLSANITGIQDNGQITGLGVTSQIYVGLSASAVSASIGLTAAGCTSSTSTPTVLTWSYPYNSGNMPTSSIQYNAASGAQGPTQSAFYFQFSIPVNSPDTPYLFTVCSTGTPGQPSTQCFNVDNLVFVWHCLAEDTQVMRADGTPVRIDQMDNTVRVRTGIGDGSLAVEATWRGTHERMVRLTTESGHSLLATEAHPVMTPVGLIAAGELRPGTHVMLEGGRSTPLAAVEEVDYGGRVWNLMLGNHEDRAAGHAGEAALFVANGIVVGDFNAQGRMYRASRRSLDFMRARIPQSFHRDYESALADARR